MGDLFYKIRSAGPEELEGVIPRSEETLKLPDKVVSFHSFAFVQPINYKNVLAVWRQ